MDVLCFEYATGGGGFEDASLIEAGSCFLREGAAMLRAVAADLRRLPDVTVRLLLDRRLRHLEFPECVILEVAGTRELEQRLAAESSRADGVFLIAPECGGVLEHCTRVVEQAGGVLWTPTGEFLRVGCDKNAAAECWASAGVRTPFGRPLKAGGLLPVDFPYPAVLKPADGAGSTDVRLIPSWRADFVVPSHSPRWRLEQFVPGRAASVLMLAIDGRQVCFPPCWQHLSDDGQFKYRGGSTPIPAGLAARAETLARAAAAALPKTNGIFGLDIVLASERGTGDGRRAAAMATGDGEPNDACPSDLHPSDLHPSDLSPGDLNPGDLSPGDVVIEVNPRLTTSYLGVRRMLADNPLEALLRRQVPATWRLLPEVSVATPLKFAAGEGLATDEFIVAGGLHENNREA